MADVLIYAVECGARFFGIFVLLIFVLASLQAKSVAVGVGSLVAALVTFALLTYPWLR